MTDTGIIREKILKKKLTFNKVGDMCNVSPTTVAKLMVDVNAKFTRRSIAKLFKGLGITDDFPKELTPPGGALDNEILRAKSIINSYKFIQRQSKRGAEEWTAWLQKLSGLYSRVDEIRKTLGVIGDKR